MERMKIAGDNVNFDMPAYLADLEHLVNIDSGSSCPEGVAQVAEFFRQGYLSLGWHVVVHQFDPAVGPCLEIVNRSSDRYDLLFMGHMDTVFPKGTVLARPFSIRENVAYGPGVNDMKSGLLLMYHALKALESAGQLEDAAICVALNSDEEVSSAFSRPWLEQLSKRSDHALVLEAARADGNLVNRRKGVGRYKISLAGVAAHSGVDPEKGRSAIQELAHWILGLHAKTNYDVGTTVNVGRVSGGTAVNVVADKAEAEVDIRFFEIGEATAIEAFMRELTDHPVTPGVTAFVKGGVSRPPMNPSDATLELCRKVEEIGSRLGMQIGWTVTGGGSDGCFSADLGVPTIDGLGPVGGGSHGISEYLRLQSIEPRFHLLYRLTQYLVGRD